MVCVLVLFMDLALPPQSLDPRVERRMAVLRELTDIAMTLVRDVARRALDPDAPNDAVCALGLAYTRLARAVRQTIALEARMANEAADETRRTVRDRGAQAKRDARRLVKRVIAEAHDDDEEEIEDLFDELDERLLDEDDTAFGDMPLGEIVARICRDLDVEFDAELWADELPQPIAASRPAPASRPAEPTAQPAAPDPDAWLKDPPAGSG
jgi:hypothetical protein